MGRSFSRTAMSEHFVVVCLTFCLPTRPLMKAVCKEREGHTEPHTYMGSLTNRLITQNNKLTMQTHTHTHTQHHAIIHSVHHKLLSFAPL